jgi:hypothetical protein
VSEALWGAYEGARGVRSSIAYPTKVGMENMSMHTETANPFFSASSWPSGPGPGSTEPAGSGSGEPHWPSLQSTIAGRHTRHTVTTFHDAARALFFKAARYKCRLLGDSEYRGTNTARIPASTLARHTPRQALSQNLVVFSLSQNLVSKAPCTPRAVTAVE